METKIPLVFFLAKARWNWSKSPP